MSKISKLLVMLLALVMVVSLIAGCKPATQIQQPNPSQSGNNNQDPTDGDKDPTNATTTLPEAVDEFDGDARMIWNDIFPLAEPVTFQMAVRGEKDYQTLMEKCEWYKYMVEKTNVHIECVVLGSDYASKLNTLVSTGAAPDMVLGPITISSAQVVELAERGQIIPLEDYITDPEVMPNYQRMLKAIPIMLNKMTAPDGHIYSVAGRANVAASAWESPLEVNMGWLKQVPGYEDGKTFPKTIDEMTTVLKYFRDHDMNGNGDPTDEIPFLMVSSSTSPTDAAANLQGLMNLWGIGTKDGSNEYYVHIEDDDTVTIAPTTQNYRDCIETVALWYEEGLLWENFFQKVSNADHNKILQSTTPLWGFFNGAAWLPNGPADNGTVPWRDDVTLCIPFDTGYDVHYFVNPAYTGNLNNFTVFNTCEEPEILMAWYDLWMSLESTNNVYRGMPNEYLRWDDADDYKAYYEANPTWYLDENGNAHFPHLTQEDWVDLKKYDAELNDKKTEDHPTWSSIFNQNAVFKAVTDAEMMGGGWPRTEYGEEVVMGKFMEEHPEYFDHKMWPRPYSTADEAEALTEYWPQVFAVIQNYEAMFIRGEMDITNDADWEEYQEELKDAGSEELIETLQSMWDRVK
ncbi:MAG: hypothetical protein IJB91_06640 [Oscillospiraceae bacterium]|nr:hypothetical protein [Oscillospiraceae bacterium]